MAFFAPVNNAEQIPDRQMDAVKRPYRSYKKKFLKLRHAFRDKMRESNTLYDDEQHAKQIARRLQEQNDQLLETLLDVNESTKIPAHLRYDLRSPPPEESDVPDLEPDSSLSSFEEVQQAQAALQEARIELEVGQLDISGFEETEAALTAIISKGRSITTLSKTSHSTVDCVPPELIPDLNEETPTGYLTPAHEEDFLASLDAHLDAPHPDDQLFPPKLKPSEREREREIQLRNPMSVYNWLSHHRPKEMVEDEPSTEKPAKAPRKSSPKASTSTSAPSRASTKRDKVGSLLPKADEEVLEEDGSVLPAYTEDVTGPQKKRKRGQDDDAYRPKGGGNKKRKRASTKNSSNGIGSEAIAG